MKARAIDEAPRIQLPSALAIGFTGQTGPAEDMQANSRILDFLRERARTTQATVYGVCALLHGGELPFPEACLELGIPLQLLLPLPADELPLTFPESLRDRARRVLDCALSVEVMRAQGSEQDNRYEFGIETVHRSDLLLVLLNAPESESDEAGQIAVFAGKTGKPVVRIRPGLRTVDALSPAQEHALLHDPELNFLNNLPDCGVPAPDDSPTATALQWFKKIDANASRLAPQVRRSARIPILYTAAAAVLGGTATKSAAGIASIAVSAALGILGAVLPSALRLTRRQALWARTRTAAEVCRSEMATWDAPFRCEAIEIGSEFAGTLTALRFLKMQALTQSRVTLDEFKQRYRKDRVRGQIEYYSRNARKAEREKKVYRRVKLFSGASAVVLALAWLAGLRTLLPGNLFGLALSALFQGATVVAALEIVNDSTRRQLRYKELHDALTDWDRQLDALRTWASVLKVVAQVEKALLVELLEWRSLAKHSKLTR